MNQVRTSTIRRMEGPVRMQSPIFDGFACTVHVEGIGEVVIMTASRDGTAALHDYLTGGYLHDPLNDIPAQLMGELLKADKG